jgi:hypothetical protein
MFLTDVFAEVYISKQSMKTCFDRYGSDKVLLRKCCLAAATNKPAKEYVKCTPGQYVPDNSTTCSVCGAEPFKNRYFCPGGTFEVPQNTIQGAIACDDGMVTNKTRDGCVKESAGNNNGNNREFNGTNDRREQSLKEENNDVTKMSEKEACEYWALMNNGEKSGAYWHEETQICVPVGGNLWVAHWNKTQKKFECLNIYDNAVQSGEIKNENEEWVKRNYEAVHEPNGELKPAVIGLEWDKNFGKCTSKIERECWANGDTYDYHGTCYKHEDDEKICRNVIHGKWSIINGQKSCKCYDKEQGNIDYIDWTPTKCGYSFIIHKPTPEERYTGTVSDDNIGPAKHAETIPLGYCWNVYTDQLSYHNLSPVKNCK